MSNMLPGAPKEKSRSRCIFGVAIPLQSATQGICPRQAGVSEARSGM